MRTVRLYILVILLPLSFTTQAGAVSSPSETNLEEINNHQAGATAALILGDHTLLKPGKIAVSGHAHVSGWGADTLYGAWGLSLQAGLGHNLGVGLSYGYTDAQLRTRVWLLNIQYSPLSGANPWLHLQGALGHQFLDSSESGNVVIFEFDNPWPVQPGNPQILLDDMAWTHAYLKILVNTRLWKFIPQASLGYMHSHYSWSGHEVPTFGGLEAGLGPALSDSGNTGRTTWALGLGLDLGPVRPFAGLGAFSDGALFLARVTIIF